MSLNLSVISSHKPVPRFVLPSIPNLLPKYVLPSCSQACLSCPSFSQACLSVWLPSYTQASQCFPYYSRACVSFHPLPEPVCPGLPFHLLPEPVGLPFHPVPEPVFSLCFISLSGNMPNVFVNRCQAKAKLVIF